MLPLPPAHLQLLGVSSSDADDKNKHKILTAMVHRQTAYTVTKTIFRGRVPLIGLQDNTTGYQIDLTASNDQVLTKTQLFQTFLAINPVVYPLLVLVKFWSKQRTVNDASMGYLNSFSISLMVFFFLQCKGILPTLHRNEDSQGAPTNAPNPHVLLHHNHYSHNITNFVILNDKNIQYTTTGAVDSDNNNNDGDINRKNQELTIFDENGLTSTPAGDLIKNFQQDVTQNGNNYKSIFNDQPYQISPLSLFNNPQNPYNTNNINYNDESITNLTSITHLRQHTTPLIPQHLHLLYDIYTTSEIEPLDKPTSLIPNMDKVEELIDTNYFTIDLKQIPLYSIKWGTNQILSQIIPTLSTTTTQESHNNNNNRYPLYTTYVGPSKIKQFTQYAQYHDGKLHATASTDYHVRYSLYTIGELKAKYPQLFNTYDNQSSDKRDKSNENNSNSMDSALLYDYEANYHQIQQIDFEIRALQQSYDSKEDPQFTANQFNKEVGSLVTKRKELMYSIPTPQVPTLSQNNSNPDDQKNTSAKNLWNDVYQLLGEFFYFYSYIYNPKVHVISVRNGHFTWLHEHFYFNQKNDFIRTDRMGLFIEDPFDPMDNCARSITSHYAHMVLFEMKRSAILFLQKTPMHIIFSNVTSEVFALANILNDNANNKIYKTNLVTKIPLFWEQLAESSGVIKPWAKRYYNDYIELYLKPLLNKGLDFEEKRNKDDKDIESNVISVFPLTSTTTTTAKDKKNDKLNNNNNHYTDEKQNNIYETILKHFTSQYQSLLLNQLPNSKQNTNLDNVIEEFYTHIMAYFRAYKSYQQYLTNLELYQNQIQPHILERRKKEQLLLLQQQQQQQQLESQSPQKANITPSKPHKKSNIQSNSPFDAIILKSGVYGVTQGTLDQQKMDIALGQVIQSTTSPSTTTTTTTTPYKHTQIAESPEQEEEEEYNQEVEEPFVSKLIENNSNISSHHHNNSSEQSNNDIIINIDSTGSPYLEEEVINQNDDGVIQSVVPQSIQEVDDSSDNNVSDNEDYDDNDNGDVPKGEEEEEEDEEEDNDDMGQMTRAFTPPSTLEAFMAPQFPPFFSLLTQNIPPSELIQPNVLKNMFNQFLKAPNASSSSQKNQSRNKTTEKQQQQQIPDSVKQLYQQKRYLHYLLYKIMYFNQIFKNLPTITQEIVNDIDDSFDLDTALRFELTTSTPKTTPKTTPKATPKSQLPKETVTDQDLPQPTDDINDQTITQQQHYISPEFTLETIYQQQELKKTQKSTFINSNNRPSNIPKQFIELQNNLTFDYYDSIYQNDNILTKIAQKVSNKPSLATRIPSFKSLMQLDNLFDAFVTSFTTTDQQIPPNGKQLHLYSSLPLAAVDKERQFYLTMMKDFEMDTVDIIPSFHTCTKSFTTLHHNSHLEGDNSSSGGIRFGDDNVLDDSDYKGHLVVMFVMYHYLSLIQFYSQRDRGENSIDNNNYKLLPIELKFKQLTTLIRQQRSINNIPQYLSKGSKNQLFSLDLNSPLTTTFVVSQKTPNNRGILLEYYRLFFTYQFYNTSQYKPKDIKLHLQHDIDNALEEYVTVQIARQRFDSQFKELQKKQNKNVLPKDVGDLLIANKIAKKESGSLIPYVSPIITELVARCKTTRSPYDHLFFDEILKKIVEVPVTISRSIDLHNHAKPTGQTVSMVSSQIDLSNVEFLDPDEHPDKKSERPAKNNSRTNTSEKEHGGQKKEKTKTFEKEHGGQKKEKTKTFDWNNQSHRETVFNELARSDKTLRDACRDYITGTCTWQGKCRFSHLPLAKSYWETTFAPKHMNMVAPDGKQRHKVVEKTTKTTTNDDNNNAHRAMAGETPKPVVILTGQKQQEPQPKSTKNSKHKIVKTTDPDYPPQQQGKKPHNLNKNIEHYQKEHDIVDDDDSDENDSTQPSKKASKRRKRREQAKERAAQQLPEMQSATMVVETKTAKQQPPNSNDDHHDNKKPTMETTPEKAPIPQQQNPSNPKKPLSIIKQSQQQQQTGGEESTIKRKLTIVLKGDQKE